MPKLIPLIAIGVLRDGVSLNTPVGVPFDFTEGEVSDLDKLSAATKQDYYREPVNEVAEVVEPKKGAATNKKPAAAEGDNANL